MPKQSRDGICRLSRRRAFSRFPRRRDELCGRQARAIPVRQRVDDTTVHQGPECRGAARLLRPVVEPSVVGVVALREVAHSGASERRRRGRRGNGDARRERGRKVESTERVCADEATCEQCMTGQHDVRPEQQRCD